MFLEWRLFTQQLTIWIRMEVMTKLFQEKFATPEQRRLTFLVKQKGGDAVIHDEQAMMELWNEEVMTFALVGNERHRSTKNFDLKEILREIQCDPTKAIEKNEESFYGKLRVQMRQIREDVERTGDRVISVLTGGPHDRIIDPVRIFVRSRSFLTFPSGSPSNLEGNGQ